MRIAAALYRRGAMRVATRLHYASIAKVGPGTRFQAGVRFDRPGQVEIGSNCYFWHGVGASAEGRGSSLKIGDRVQVNRYVVLDTVGGLELCDDVLISEFAVISTHDHGHNPHSAPVLLPKTIGAGVWIGMRAMILPSCHRIGEGTIVGAGAVVTKNLPAGVVVAGNPARIVGHTSISEVAV